MKILTNILKSEYWTLRNFYYLYPRMKRVKIIDTNETFMANNCHEIVSILKSSNAFTASLDDDTYMRQYAQRAVHWDNMDIRATDPVSFVEDLIKYHILEVTSLEHN